MNKKKVRLIVGIALVVFAAWYISTYWYQLMLIQGDSMLPTYHNMQLVIVDKHSKDYDVGDVVAIDCRGLDAIIVKRIDEVDSKGFYVLGDNREHSVDSRDQRVGYIMPDDIVGEVIN